VTAAAAKRTYALAFLVATLAYAAYVVAMYLRDAPPAAGTSQLANVLMCWLISVWVDLDSRGRPEIYRPFEFTFFVFYFAPFYLPYYLVRTRRGRGIALFVAVLVLYMLGHLIALALYYNAV